MRYAIVGLLLFVSPFTVFGAGFSRESLFLSKEPVVDGEEVAVHATVANKTVGSFNGTLKVYEGEKLVGSTAVSLEEGDATTASVSWEPSAGQHTLVAKLYDKAGTLTEQTSADFTVAPKPVAQSSSDSDSSSSFGGSGSVTSSQGIQNSIARVSPALASTTAPVFSGIDAARTSSIRAIDQGLGWSKDQIAKSSAGGKVLGAEAKEPSKDAKDNNILSTLWLVLATIVLYILTVLRFLLSSAGIFYPFLLVVFLFVLWRMYRRYKRR